MTTSRGHQGAHGIGQAEDQLNQQAEAAAQIQGQNNVDQAILAASQERSSEMNEVIDTENDQ
ncbi:hypothetical protein [Paenibacillus silvisoli]|uniref:hypothetical protein n=1 Tax=Paenibacillus silvisoli TaxID=3110539 RepID=UPI0028056C5A|nr:hypothetical protein [Paenibacillus silvisoli]